MTQETEREKFEALIGEKMAFEAWMKFDAPKCNDARTLAFAAWQARAALEAKQAEVKMPEPDHWIAPDYGLLFPSKKSVTRYMSNIGDERAPTASYTEQQLRALLAQHGIKIVD